MNDQTTFDTMIGMIGRILNEIVEEAKIGGNTECNRQLAADARDLSANLSHYRDRRFFFHAGRSLRQAQERWMSKKNKHAEIQRRLDQLKSIVHVAIMTYEDGIKYRIDESNGSLAITQLSAGHDPFLPDRSMPKPS